MNDSDDRRGKRPQGSQDPQDRKSGHGPSPSPQQQRQQGAAGDRQHGEGNYKATRDYDRGVKEHLRTHDVEREARDAAPRSEEEERQMREAEELGKKKAQGMQDSRDRMDRTDPDAGDVSSR